jgi:hypothetical protein
MTVTGTQVVGTEIASVFTSTTTSDPTPTNELVVKRPGGVYVLSDPSTEPPFDQLYPSMILPFPLAVVAPTEQVSCHALDVGISTETGGRITRTSSFRRGYSRWPRPRTCRPDTSPTWHTFRSPPM